MKYRAIYLPADSDGKDSDWGTLDECLNFVYTMLCRGCAHEIGYNYNLALTTQCGAEWIIDEDDTT